MYLIYYFLNEGKGFGQYLQKDSEFLKAKPRITKIILKIG